MQRKVRTFSPRVAVALMLLLAAVVAAPAALAAEQPATVKLWDYHVHDAKFRKNIFKEFNQSNPDIKVVYTSQIVSSYQTVLDASFRSGDPPDIFQVTGTISLGSALEMGWVIPLDDIASSKEELRAWMARFPQDLVPFLENANIVNGKVYSWPIGGEGGRMLLFWNTKLFREAGLKGADGGPATPETWNDVRQFAKKITELGQGKVYGIVHGVKDPGVWGQDINWSLAASGGWPAPFGFDLKTGHFDYHHPAFRGGMQLWLDMKKDGSVFPGELSMDDEMAKYKFSQDLAGMIFGGPWVPGGLLALSDTLEFDTVLPPTEVRGARKGYLGIGPLAGMSEYLISSKTKNRSAVWRVVQFMTSQQYQEGWVKAGGGLSVFPEYNKPEFFPHPSIAKIANMAKTGRRVTPQISSEANAALMEAIYTLAKPDYGSGETQTGIYIGKLPADIWDDIERRSEIALDEKIADAVKRGIKLSRADFTFPDWDITKNYVQSKGTK